jgi:hypothetical protein
MAAWARVDELDVLRSDSNNPHAVKLFDGPPA